MALKGSEEYVADCLVDYFAKKHATPTYIEGEDPPDVYLSLGGNTFSVEITDVNYNSLYNSTGTTKGYFTLLYELNSGLGETVPDGLMVYIKICHADVKSQKVKKAIRQYLKEKIKNVCADQVYEKHFGRVYLKVSARKSQSAKKIQGTVSNYGVLDRENRDVSAVEKNLRSFNVGMINSELLIKAITAKKKKCNSVKKPVWLALNDKYYSNFTDFEEKNEHFNHYDALLKNIDDFGVFEKILIVFANRDVYEYST